MRRLATALVSGIFILAALPGGSLAKAPIAGAPDQSDTTNTGAYGTHNDVAQTFTAGQDGLLTDVKLNVLGSGGEMSVALCDAAVSACSAWSLWESAGTSYGWVDFPFSYPQPVAKGTKYSIRFNLSELGETYDASYDGTDAYTGGEAMEYEGSSWVTPPMTGVTDFEFQTLVDPQTTTLAWDKTQITSGQTSALVLTETFAFPAYYGVQPLWVQPASLYAGTYSVKPDALPAWFSATGVTCSSQIDPADCKLAKVTDTSGSIPVVPDGNPITISVTGNAAPSAAGTITSKIEGCSVYTESLTVCIPGTANIQVIAATPSATPSAAPSATAAATPPPTTSADGSTTPGGTPLYLLPLALISLVCGTLILSRRAASHR